MFPLSKPAERLQAPGDSQYICDRRQKSSPVRKGMGLRFCHSGATTGKKAAADTSSNAKPSLSYTPELGQVFRPIQLHEQKESHKAKP